MASPLLLCALLLAAGGYDSLLQALLLCLSDRLCSGTALGRIVPSLLMLYGRSIGQGACASINLSHVLQM